MLSALTHVKDALGKWCAGGFRPFETTSWEWFIMRLLFAGVVMHTFSDWHPYDFADQPAPNGIAHLFDLTFLHKPGMYQTVLWITGIFSVIYVVGTESCLRWSLPILTLFNVVVRTYANSQGSIHHGFQLVSLILLTQTLVVWWWHLWGRKINKLVKLRDYLTYYSLGVVAFSYSISALTKTLSSRGMWIFNAEYIAGDIVKSQRLNYYKQLDPALQADPALAVWFLQHPFAAQLVFGSGYILEALAFVALRDRVWAFLVGCALILFHQGVYWLMGLTFHYHEALLVIFLLNIPWWIMRMVRLAFPRPLS